MKLSLMGFMLIFLAAPGSAFAIGQDACEAITREGTFDKSLSYTNKQNFVTAQNFTCQSKFEEYTSAQSVASDASVNIIDLLEAAGGETVTASNYKRIRDQYCHTDFSLGAQSNDLMRMSVVASNVIAREYVECVRGLKGFFGYVTQTANRDAFAVYVQLKSDGNQAFDVTEISAPATEIVCANHEERVTRTKPFHVIGSHTFNCINKNPNKSFLLVVNTSEGPLGRTGEAGVQLVGTDASIADLIERLEKVEGQVPPTGTVSYFGLPSCPTGWSADTESAGRVMVGAGEGSGLTPRFVGSTGGEEMHKMTLDELVPHNHTLHRGASRGPGTNDNIPSPTILSSWVPGPDAPTSSSGAGTPFNVMPPFVVRTVCTKD